MDASPNVKQYFESIKHEVNRMHAVATKARKCGFDAEPTVEISLAKNMAERVVGLISVEAPQIVNSGIVERIIELEKQYGALDWRVALKVAEEVATEKFCTFTDKKEAMLVAIKTGFAYSTLGVVSAPLDGLIDISFKKRMDGNGEYLSVKYSGPIRNAGGTNAAVSVIIADYIRKLMGYAAFDATDAEVKRAVTELQDYHERVTNLQYYPSPAEVEFLVKHMPVEIDADPSERFEVSNYKNLPRIETDIIRSGYCLVYSSCIPLKAPKLWKQLGSWGKEFNLEQWDFLEEFIKVQKKEKAKGAKSASSSSKIQADHTYIKDLVAGRPILAHPLRSGGFRLRYGRARTSGYSSYALHPATMAVTTNYIATGTQLKLERPGKGTVVTACDTIEGPIVKLVDGSVLQPTTMEQVSNANIAEILYLGDILVNYGDFFNRAHALVPAGYCPEWWIQEFEKKAIESFGAVDYEKIAELTDVSVQTLREVFTNPAQISVQTALHLSNKLNIPLHPKYTYYWNTLSLEQLAQLRTWLARMKLFTEQGQTTKGVVLLESEPKRALELIGVPHTIVNKENVVIAGDHATILSTVLAFSSPEQPTGETTVDALNSIAPVFMRDKGGTFIGSRMGRPEKAKMRKLTGSPHALFPVGEEGGKYRSFQNAMQKGRITAEFPLYQCTLCKTQHAVPLCPGCSKPTQRLFYCKGCALWSTEKTCKTHGETVGYQRQAIPIKTLFEHSLRKLGMKTYPELIKGVRGTSNVDHTPEHFAKGILRAKHHVHVNKDGTIRYDMTQLPMTHFKPREIGTSVAKLKSLGYDTDIKGKPLEKADQVLEIKPQDIVLPQCPDSPDEGAATVLIKAAQFVDDLLVSFYNLQPFYNVKTADDLVGTLLLCLAPHTSAAIVGRLIGFSKTQGFFAHPYLHAATRRDCDGDESSVSLLLDAFLNFSKRYLPASRGSTMDAPLVLTSVIIPTEVDDMVFDLDRVGNYPLALYEAALEYKMPWDVPIQQLKKVLETPEQYEGMKYTHETSNFNNAALCSSYKTLPSMQEKLAGQMVLAEKIRAVDTTDVARLVIEKHFIRDTKGNLRKFSMQEFRCVHCNEKYRRPPLVGKCLKCKGKIVFTISEGSVIKYLEPTISLAKKYNVSDYLKQSIDLLQERIEGVFGKEKEKQTGLGAWFG